RRPGAAHHLRTSAGAVAYYLSPPAARAPGRRALTAPIVRELRPLLVPPLAIFAAWRRLRRDPHPLGGSSRRPQTHLGSVVTACGPRRSTEA
ncbi:MAG: hypothetical protein ACTHOE_00005, partial [Conexibacter sp.]